MLTGFAAAAVPLALAAALVPGAPAGAQATTTPAAAMAWRNRLREIVTSRSISLPPRIRSAPDYSRTLEEHDRDRPRGRRPVHLVPRVPADELRPQPLPFFARRFRYHAGARSWPAFDATTTTASPSGHPKTGAERGSPVRRPTVVISTTGPHAPQIGRASCREKVET